MSTPHRVRLVDLVVRGISAAGLLGCLAASAGAQGLPAAFSGSLVQGAPTAEPLSLSLDGVGAGKTASLGSYSAGSPATTRASTSGPSVSALRRTGPDFTWATALRTKPTSKNRVPAIMKPQPSTSNEASTPNTMIESPPKPASAVTMAAQVERVRIFMVSSCREWWRSAHGPGVQSRCAVRAPAADAAAVACRTMGGAGIGLAYAHELAYLMGGRLEVDSTPATFAERAATLAGRLAADPMVRRWGRLHTGIVGSLVALVGCVLVVAVHAPGPAVVGFALAGGAAGLLVPVAFSWAGELDPDRSDEVVARVNLFNYGGALIGAVALGALAGNASALGFGFALPAVALVVALPLLRAHRRSAQAPLPDQGRH